MAKTVAAEATVRRPAKTSVNTSMRRKIPLAHRYRFAATCKALDLKHRFTRPYTAHQRQRRTETRHRGFNRIACIYASDAPA